MNINIKTSKAEPMKYTRFIIYLLLYIIRLKYLTHLFKNQQIFIKYNQNNKVIKRCIIKIKNYY